MKLVLSGSMSNYTLDTKGIKKFALLILELRIKAFTVFLSIRANGDKDPALIVFSEKSGIPKSVLSKLNVSNDIQIASSSNGYVTVEILSNYINQNFNDVELVVSDKCTSHTSTIISQIYREKGIVHISIPSACMKYIQPLDVSNFRSFKAKLEDFKNLYLSQNFENRTKAGNIKNPTRQDAINWISFAYREISDKTIQKAFRLCNLGIEQEGNTQIAFDHCPRLKKHLVN